MHTDDGAEVYELKPAWQVTIYGKEVEEIKNERRIKEPFLPGWKQREGYINALRQAGALVNEKGNKIGEYIMEKGLELYIDEDYTAKFYAYPDQPGMIYYYLKKNPQPDPGKQIAVSLSDSGNNVQKKGQAKSCKIIQLDEVKKAAATTVEVGIGTTIAADNATGDAIYRELIQ